MHPKRPRCRRDGPEDAAPSVPRAWGSHHLEAFGPRGCGTRTCLSRVELIRGCPTELHARARTISHRRHALMLSHLRLARWSRCARGRDRSGQRPGRATSTDMGLRLRRRGRPRALRQTESPKMSRRTLRSKPLPNAWCDPGWHSFRLHQNPVSNDRHGRLGVAAIQSSSNRRREVCGLGLLGFSSRPFHARPSNSLTARRPWPGPTGPRSAAAG